MKGMCTGKISTILIRGKENRISAFCSLTVGQNIYTQKIGPLSQLAMEKITFLPKPDINTYRHTDGRTFL